MRMAVRPSHSQIEATQNRSILQRHKRTWGLSLFPAQPAITRYPRWQARPADRRYSSSAKSRDGLRARGVRHRLVATRNRGRSNRPCHCIRRDAAFLRIKSGLKGHLLRKYFFQQLSGPLGRVITDCRFFAAEIQEHPGDGLIENVVGQIGLGIGDEGD